MCKYCGSEFHAEINCPESNWERSRMAERSMAKALKGTQMYGFYEAVCFECDPSGVVIGTADMEGEAYNIGSRHALVTALPGFGHLSIIRLAPWV